MGRKLRDQDLSKYPPDSVLRNSAIPMLLQLSDTENAEHILTMMKDKSVATYGAMMQSTAMLSSSRHKKSFVGYVDRSIAENALDLYEGMAFKPNKVIHRIIFKSCAEPVNSRAKTLSNK